MSLGLFVESFIIDHRDAQASTDVQSGKFLVDTGRFHLTGMVVEASIWLKRLIENCG
jgi:hypothetical protein